MMNDGPRACTCIILLRCKTARGSHVALTEGLSALRVALSTMLRLGFNTSYAFDLILLLLLLTCLQLETTGGQN